MKGNIATIAAVIWDAALHQPWQWQERCQCWKHILMTRNIPRTFVHSLTPPCSSKNPFASKSYISCALMSAQSLYCCPSPLRTENGIAMAFSFRLPPPPRWVSYSLWLQSTTAKKDRFYTVHEAWVTSSTGIVLFMYLLFCNRAQSLDAYKYL